jgi:hypothetical protein
MREAVDVGVRRQAVSVDKQTAKRLKKLTVDVQAILLRDWDPIGIAAHPGAQDEYDSYAPHIAGMLVRGTNVEWLADHLHQLATVAMGLQGNKSHETEVAEKLLALLANRTHDDMNG